MAQVGVAYVDIKPDWQGFNREVSRGIPNVNRQFGKVGSGAGAKLGAEMSAKLVGSFADAGKRAAGVFAKGATAGVGIAGAGIAAGLVGAVNAASDFEQQLSSLGSVSDASAKQMEALRKSAITAGAATKFSALDAAKAQTELAKGGLATSEILKGGLDSALALAAAGELDLADAASTTVNAMKLFGIRGRDSIKVADAFATAANSTTADVSDFALALNQTGSAAKTVGLSFPETITALEALAEVGIKGSDAGTSLKTALVQLASPTSDKAVELTRKLGINVFDAKGNIKSLTAVSKELRGGLGGLTKEQRISAATTLVGQDGFRALLALYDAGPKKIAKLEDELKKQGTAAEVAKKKQDNLKGSLEQLGGSLETAGINVGTLLIPAIRAGADELTDFTNKIGKIAGRDDLDFGEKLSRTFDAVKVEVKPFVDKIKAAIIKADIPGEIGKIISGGSDRIGKGFDGSPFVDKLLDQVKAAHLPEKLGDLISKGTPLIVKALAGAGALGAGAFAKAFVSSDGWGKIAIAAFLLPKLGGFKAFKILGASLGANFGAAFAESSAVAGVPLSGGVGGRAGGKGGPSSKSGLRPGNPLGKAGAINPLLVVGGNPVNNNPKPQLTAPKPTVAQRVGSGARGAKGALSSGLNKVPILAAVTVPFIELEAEKRATAQENVAKSFQRANDSLQKAIPDPARWKVLSDAIAVAQGKFSGLPEDFDAATNALDDLGVSLDRKPAEVQNAQKAFDSLKDKFAVTQALFKKGITLNPDVTVKDARVVQDAIEKMASGSSSSVKDLRTNVRLNTRAIKRALGDDTAEGKEALAANFRAAAANVKTSMAQGTIATKEGTAEIERLMVAALSQFGFSKKQALNIAKTGDADANKGREGGASRVISRKQRGGALATGGHMTVPGTGSGDKVHLEAMVEPGEKVFVLNRNASKKLGALQRLNADVPRFQTGGLLQRLAGGGSVTGDTDFLPALMGALKRLSAAAKTPIFVQSGRRTVAEQLAQGPSTPGHPVAGPNGPHVRGIAADITPGFPVFGALASKFGLGFTVMPQEPWHIQLLDAAKATAADFAAPELKRLLVSGPDSPLKGVVQGALDTARGAAQQVVARAAAASGANGSESAPFSANASAGGSYDKAALKKLWTGAGGDPSVANLMGAIALAESGGNPSAHNPSGASGLWQILGVPFPGDPFDPATNARMAVAKYESQGLGAWEVYTKGTYKQYLKKGGLLGLTKGGAPKKGIKPPLPAGIDLGKALKSITAGRTTKLKDAATNKLLTSITGIGFDARAKQLADLSGKSDLYGEYADRASRLTDSNKIQDALQGELDRRQLLNPLPSPLFPPDAQQAIVDGLLGRVSGGTQLDWLGQQLTALFDWRNVITDTDPMVVRLRDETATLLSDAQARLEQVAAQIKAAERQIATVEKQRDHASKHEDTLKDNIKDELDKPRKKRDEKKLAVWRQDLIETHSEHVAYNQQLTNLRGEQKGRDRIQTDLTDTLIPALTDKHDSLEGSHGDLLGSLVDAQGLGGPTTRLATLPPLGTLGGKLFDVQSLMKDLTDNPPRIEATVPAASDTQQKSADILADLLREANVRTAVSEAQFDVFKGLPFAGSFDKGGYIDGPVGKPYAAVVHGGEYINTAAEVSASGGGSVPQVVVSVASGMEWLKQFIRVEVKSADTLTARTGSRGLPGKAGVIRA